MSFDLIFPSDLASRRCESGAGKPVPDFVPKQPFSVSARNGKITIGLADHGNCSVGDISLVFQSKAASVSDATRDSAFETARSWFICVHEDTRHLACAQSNPLKTTPLLLELRSSLTQWGSHKAKR